MIECKIELEPNERMPFEVVNIFVNKLREMLRDKDISGFSISMPSASDAIIVPEWEIYYAEATAPKKKEG